jgi:hypothetical protein
MRKLALTGLGLALTGCAATKTEPVPAMPAIPSPSSAQAKAERDAADAAWLNCVAPLLRHLDDGTSDPRSIAIGARAGCPEQFRRVLFAYLPPGGSIAQLAPIMESALDDGSVKLVLEQRSRRHDTDK